MAHCQWHTVWAANIRCQDPPSAVILLPESVLGLPTMAPAETAAVVCTCTDACMLLCVPCTISLGVNARFVWLCMTCSWLELYMIHMFCVSQEGGARQGHPSLQDCRCFAAASTRRSQSSVVRAFLKSCVVGARSPHTLLLWCRLVAGLLPTAASCAWCGVTVTLRALALLFHASFLDNNERIRSCLTKLKALCLSAHVVLLGDAGKERCCPGHVYLGRAFLTSHMHPVMCHARALFRFPPTCFRVCLVCGDHAVHHLLR